MKKNQLLMLILSTLLSASAIAEVSADSARYRMGAVTAMQPPPPVVIPPPAPPIPPAPPAASPSVYSQGVFTRTYTNANVDTGGGFSARNVSGAPITITRISIDVTQVVQGPGSAKVTCFTGCSGLLGSTTSGGPDANGLYALVSPITILNNGQYVTLSSANPQNVRANQVPSGGVAVKFLISTGFIVSVSAGR